MSLVTKYTVPHHLPCFSGHFPGNPLVPGALLLVWVESQYALAGGHPNICGIKSAKFLKPVPPGAQLEFEFIPNEDKRSVKFSISITTDTERNVAVSGNCDCTEDSS